MNWRNEGLIEVISGNLFMHLSKKRHISQFQDVKLLNFQTFKLVCQNGERECKCVSELKRRLYEVLLKDVN